MTAAAERAGARWRHYLVAVAGALWLFALLRVFQLGLAEREVLLAPASAGAGGASHPELLLRSAQRGSRDPARAAVAAAEARAAIARVPLDPRGYRLLAEAIETTGGDASSVREVAAFRGPRDFESQAWVIDRAVRAGQHAAALRDLDRMLRARPEIGHLVAPTFHYLALQPAAQAQLLQDLAADPPWRETMLPRLIRVAPDLRALSALLDALRSSPAGLRPDEFGIWLARLVQEGQAGTAYLQWVQSLSRDAQARIGNVFDGGFEREPTGIGFDWQWQPVPGVRIHRAAIDGTDGRASLGLAFDGLPMQFQQVRQLLALAPGSYRLRGRVQLRQLQSERGLVWSVTCVPSGALLAETDPFSGDYAWRAFASEFVVPASRCDAQWLQLRQRPARVRSERRIEGEAWFDGLEIDRWTPPTPATSATAR